MTPEQLLLFMATKQKLAAEVFTCYEAGAFGFYLRRQFEAMGVGNCVAQP